MLVLEVVSIVLPLNLETQPPLIARMGWVSLEHKLGIYLPSTWKCFPHNVTSMLYLDIYFKRIILFIVFEPSFSCIEDLGEVLVTTPIMSNIDLTIVELISLIELKLKWCWGIDGSLVG